MTVAEIASKLQIGDKKLIAELSGFSTNYVYLIFEGLRNSESKGAKLVLQSACDLLKTREDLKLRAQQRKSN